MGHGQRKAARSPSGSLLQQRLCRPPGKGAVQPDRRRRSRTHRHARGAPVLRQLGSGAKAGETRRAQSFWPERESTPTATSRKGEGGSAPSGGSGHEAAAPHGTALGVPSRAAPFRQRSRPPPARAPLGAARLNPPCRGDAAPAVTERPPGRAARRPASHRAGPGPSRAAPRAPRGEGTASRSRAPPSPAPPPLTTKTASGMPSGPRLPLAAASPQPGPLPLAAAILEYRRRARTRPATRRCRRASARQRRPRSDGRRGAAPGGRRPRASPAGGTPPATSAGGAEQRRRFRQRRALCDSRGSAWRSCGAGRRKLVGVRFPRIKTASRHLVWSCAELRPAVPAPCPGPPFARTPPSPEARAAPHPAGRRQRPRADPQVPERRGDAYWLDMHLPFYCSAFFGHRLFLACLPGSRVLMEHLNSPFIFASHVKFSASPKQQPLL